MKIQAMHVGCLFNVLTDAALTCGPQPPLQSFVKFRRVVPPFAGLPLLMDAAIPFVMQLAVITGFDVDKASALEQRLRPLRVRWFDDEGDPKLCFKSYDIECALAELYRVARHYRAARHATSRQELGVSRIGLLQSLAVASVALVIQLAIDESTEEVHEMRALEKVLIDTLKDHEANRDVFAMDIHREGASLAFEVPLDQVTKAQRHMFKEHFFLTAYTRGIDSKHIGEAVMRAAELLRAQLKGSDEVLENEKTEK